MLELPLLRPSSEEISTRFDAFSFFIASPPSQTFRYRKIACFNDVSLIKSVVCALLEWAAPGRSTKSPRANNYSRERTAIEIVHFCVNFTESNSRQITPLQVVSVRGATECRGLGISYFPRSGISRDHF